MRKQFKNIPIGSIITPCAVKGASLRWKRTMHKRVFAKVHGSAIKNTKTNEQFDVDNQKEYWNIQKLGGGPCQFKPVPWSRF